MIIVSFPRSLLNKIKIIKDNYKMIFFPYSMGLDQTLLYGDHCLEQVTALDQNDFEHNGELARETHELSR